MSAPSDCTKMMALGRKFSIGTLYDYTEDVILTNIRLWNPSDVDRLASVDTKTKEFVRVHSMKIEIDKEDEEEEDEVILPWMSDLGLDDHSAVSLMAGLLRPSSGGAWQYVADRANWALDTAEYFSLHRSEVVVHCRLSSKKVSIDVKNNQQHQLEIVCRPERLGKATHVVVAITYGQEAFCTFSHANSKNFQENEEDEPDKMLMDYAQFFADGLLSGREQLAPDQDDEEDSSCPLDLLQCILYSDSIGDQNGPSWTTKSAAEQYQACRKLLLSHQASKSVPMKVWLYPLVNLIKNNNKINISRMPLDISRDLVFCYQVLWSQLSRIRISTGLLMSEVASLADRQWMPKSILRKIKQFDQLLTKFAMILIKSLSEWTISVRLSGGLKEETVVEMIQTLATSSPLAPKELNQWINQQKRHVDNLKILHAQLSGVLFVSEEEILTRILTHNRAANSFAVVLHVPSLAGQLDGQIHAINQFIDAFNTSNWMIKRAINNQDPVLASESSDHRRIFDCVEEFSEWVKDHNRDTNNVKYVVFYDESIHASNEISPFMRLLRDCSSSSKFFSTSFTLPKAPGEVTVYGNLRGVINLSWKAEFRADFSNYLLQYRNAEREEEIWYSVRHAFNTMTIDYLQSGETYVFRVAIVTRGGRSPFGPESDEVTIDPVCPPPGGLECQYTTDTSIKISWEKSQVQNQSEKKLKMTSYSIECWIHGHQESTIFQRSTMENTFTLEPLDPGTRYCVQIRIVCVDEYSGSTFRSAASPVLKTRTLDEPERLAEFLRKVSQKCFLGQDMEGYKLPVKEYLGRTISSRGVDRYVFGEPNYSLLIGKRRRRTILMLGATGSGKTTLINAMVNYMLDVQWDDDFRFKLIDEPTNKTQAHSQTDLITTYDLYEMKGSRLEYSLTVVDTPGFGDTRGINRDKEITEQIQTHFQCQHGIQQLEAVCFVVQSGLARLTPTQKYIFDSILSIFGNDIRDNIRLMVTFSDGAQPPILEAVKAAGIPTPMDHSTGLPLHHKFNSSIFFESNKKDRQMNQVNQTYFEKAAENFKCFFEDLSLIAAKSLLLTREVLDERKQLEALVEGLQMRTQIKLTSVGEFQKIKKILTENKENMEANKNFEFEVEFIVPKSTDISGTGQFTTNCDQCKITCHFPCRQASDENKDKCSVMDNGNCKICKCPWNVHFNQKYKFEMTTEKVKRTSDDIRKQYQVAEKETLTNEELLQRIETEIGEHESQLLELMEATYPHIRRLDEIALRPHPFSAPDYIDLMIEAEKREHRSGYQQRIVTLEKLRQMAAITANLIRDQHNNS